MKPITQIRIKGTEPLFRAPKNHQWENERGEQAKKAAYLLFVSILGCQLNSCKDKIPAQQVLELNQRISGMNLQKMETIVTDTVVVLRDSAITQGIKKPHLRRLQTTCKHLDSILSHLRLLMSDLKTIKYEVDDILYEQENNFSYLTIAQSDLDTILCELVNTERNLEAALCHLQLSQRSLAMDERQVKENLHDYQTNNQDSGLTESDCQTTRKHGKTILSDGKTIVTDLDLALIDCQITLIDGKSTRNHSMKIIKGLNTTWPRLENCLQLLEGVNTLIEVKVLQSRNTISSIKRAIKPLFRILRKGETVPHNKKYPVLHK